ncbi:MAG: ATP-binding protein [Desulfobacterales bacterium]|nr:ATP-binding protein [Desulfobacterales bacterium]
MHHFINFKGFAHAALDLFRPLTVLIGPNGSGKSNVIEGVELLSFIAHGRPLHEISDVGRGVNGLEIRGGLAECARHGQNSFDLGFFASINFEGEMRPFGYTVSVGTKPEPRIISESLAFLEGPTIFKTVGRRPGRASADIKVEYNNFARGGKKPHVHVSSNHSVLSEYKEFATKNTKYQVCVEVVNGIMNYLRASFVFDPNPKLMRVYERMGNRILSRDGANLSAVLYGLSKGTKEQKRSLERLVGWIKHLPEEPYYGMDFVETRLNDVIFGLREVDSDWLVDARLLSDGTLRSLAVLTALETVDHNSRVVIEEFDNGLHPSRLRLLTDAMKSCCDRRKLNVLVTTHNPVTLNGLESEQLEGVAFCAWDTEEMAFKLIRLYDLPRYDEFLERGPLGDLVTRRVVEQYLAPRFEENQKQKALAWIQKLP